MQKMRHKNHDDLEKMVNDKLKDLGYLTDCATYHEKMAAPIADLLKSIFTPASLGIRGRADRIAVHSSGEVFEWETKTHDSGNLHDMCLEALPLVHHMSKDMLGVPCLYVYSEPSFDRVVRGFWTNCVPEIEVIHIPARKPNPKEIIDFKNLVKFYEDIFTRYFPRAELKIGKIVRGSSDPFVVIKRKLVDDLPPWESLLPGDRPSERLPVSNGRMVSPIQSGNGWAPPPNMLW